jgi:clan AA aspartic protease (TIGR02281 family)
MLYILGSGEVRSILLFIIMMAIFVPPSYGEMYKWVDEKGTVYFTDDLSSIPEKYRQDAETRRPSKETLTPQPQEELKPSPPQKVSEPEGITIDLVRKHELLLTEVILDGRIRHYFIVDTGASFTLINRATAKELGITEDENTPYIRVASVSSVFSVPLVTLGSVRVGDAEVENVEAVIYPMAASGDGLLGNSFLNKFRVVIDSNKAKMILYPMKGISSQDFPGGYSRDYWVGQFRFYSRNLEALRKQRADIESQGKSRELVRVNNAIRYFENQLDELERRASFAGVPRNWRE